jgi:hypothetical protein
MAIKIKQLEVQVPREDGRLYAQRMAAIIQREMPAVDTRIEIDHLVIALPERFDTEEAVGGAILRGMMSRIEPILSRGSL